MKTPIHFRRLCCLLILVMIAGCSRLPFGFPTEPPADSPTPSQAAPTVIPSPTLTETPSGPVTLRVWLPPQFDPASDSQAGRLLQARLEEFVKRRPGIRLDVRVKALDGPGGILESLSTTSAAAPSALPDLVALPRPILEAAALKGLLLPFDGLTIALDDTDWYNYARELARLQNSTYGLPFAGDALLMIYRPGLVEQPPRAWEDVLLANGPLAYPIADPQALCTLAFYQAAGGQVQDDQGRPWLDVATLSQVLSFYQDIAAAGLWLPALPQIETDDDIWTVFLEGQATQVITWFSRYMRQLTASTENATTSTPAPESLDSLPAEEFTAAPIPTPDGVRYTLANGWVWALANHQPERQTLSVQLAEFLTQADFLAQWTLAAGYLPPRSNALSAWADSPSKSLAGQIVISSHLVPSSDVLTSLAPHLKVAGVGILEGKGDPLTLAQEALDNLENP